MCKMSLKNCLNLTFIIIFSLMEIRVVHGGFKFLSSMPLSLHFGLEDRVEVNCSTNDRKAKISLWISQPLVQWNFTEMTVASDKLLMNGSIFVLYRSGVGNGNALRCKAENPEGKIIWSPAPIPIIVFHDLETNEFLGIQNNQPTSINSGETLTLQCYMKLGFVNPYSIHWFKDGVKVIDSSDSRINISRTFVNISPLFGKFVQQIITIRISKAKVADSGVYMCKGPEGRNKTVKANVKALKPPKLSWQPENRGSIVIHEEKDSSIQLRCHLQQGNPKPKFSWFKDDKPLYPKENWLTSPSCDHLKEGVYYFTNGSNQDVIICGAPIKYEKFAGTYTCRADNEQGYDKIDVTLNILATAKIQEPKKKNTRLVVAFGESVQQICRARGNPTPEIEWRKVQNSNSKVLSLGVGNHSASLLIHSVDENDEGNYSCIARQSHKHADQLFVQIKLISRPPSQEPQTGNSNVIIGIVVGCVAFSLIIAVVALYFGNRRYSIIKKKQMNFNQNITLSPTRHFKQDLPLEVKELTKADSKDMIVVSAQPETDFTPSYCESFQEEDATTKEIAEFLARRKNAKARESLLKCPDRDSGEA